MALHPRVMQKAQEDIDRVTEGERLPTFDDWERLSYINAIILEVLRYNTVTPLGRYFVKEVSTTVLIDLALVVGLPHCVAKDDIYNGVLVPKGSMVCANLWCVCLASLCKEIITEATRLIFRDPGIFADPDNFVPERFLGDEGARCREVLNMAWGFGKR